MNKLFDPSTGEFVENVGEKRSQFDIDLSFIRLIINSLHTWVVAEENQINVFFKLLLLSVVLSVFVVIVLLMLLTYGLYNLFSGLYEAVRSW